jgi:hypothetical protein
MSKDKIKDFQEFIKQDFDIVKDYKNASKELTAKEAKYREDLKWIGNKCYGRASDVGNMYIKDMTEFKNISKALTELEEYRKRDTPMKPYFEHAYICSAFSNEYVGKSDNYCTNCGQKLDKNI